MNVCATAEQGNVYALDSSIPTDARSGSTGGCFVTMGGGEKYDAVAVVVVVVCIVQRCCIRAARIIPDGRGSSTSTAATREGGRTVRGRLGRISILGASAKAVVT